MLIKSITLENFRQFKGIQKIEFLTEEGKQVSVILGQNTGGKTTLVRAFAWCLYGGKAETMGFKPDSLLLNEEVQVELEQLNGSDLKSNNIRSVKVTMVVTTENNMNTETGLYEANQYRIERTRNYLKNSVGKIVSSSERVIIFKQKIIDRVLDPSENEELIDKPKRIDEIISSIMPRDLSEYFFYWGEKIENISKRSDINQAIESFTGLDIYSHAITHLNHVINKYGTLIKVAGESNLGALTEQRDKLIKSLKSNESNFKIALENLNYFEERKNEAEQAFYVVKEDESKIKESERLRNKESNLKSRIESSNNNFINKFNNSKSSLFFVQKRAGELLEKVKESQKKEQEIGWANITVKAIQEILDKGVCVCGSKVSDHPEMVEHLKKEMDYAFPNALGGYIAGIETTYRYSSKDKISYARDLRSSYQNIVDLNDELNEVNEQLDEIAHLSKNKEEYLLIKQKKDDAEKKYNEAYYSVKSFENRIQSDTSDLQKLEKQLKTEIEKSNKHNLLVSRLNAAAQTLARFKEEQKEKSEEMRKQLHYFTQKYFDEMYQGNRIVEITRNFRIQTKNEVNGKIRSSETSPGLETVKNFAFVAALITIAKNVAIQKKTGKNSELAEPYPLVLDAPFSQTDETHVLNICKLLTKISEQTILVLMEKDWKIAERELGQIVGMKYVINKHSETYSTIERME